MFIADILALRYKALWGTVECRCSRERVPWERYAVEIAENLVVYEMETEEGAELLELATNIYVRWIESEVVR